MPVDDDEISRLQLIHQVYLHLFNQALTTVPLTNPSKILDIGTGSGDWAIGMADMFPGAEIIGTDIAKVQPTGVLDSVYFEICDAEEKYGWVWAPNSFDLVHFRNMAGAFADWRYIYTEAWAHLKPGGWIEVLDYDDHKLLLGFFNENSGTPKFLAALGEASRKSGRPRTIDHLDPQRLIDTGFVDVHLQDYDIPLGVWPEDEKEQSIGKLWLFACLLGVEALCLRLLTQQLGWDPDDVKRMCRTVSDEMKAVGYDAERAKGLVFRVKVLVGRKPEASNGTEAPQHAGPSV